MKMPKTPKLGMPNTLMTVAPADVNIKKGTGKKRGPYKPRKPR